MMRNYLKRNAVAVGVTCLRASQDGRCEDTWRDPSARYLALRASGHCPPTPFYVVPLEISLRYSPRKNNIATRERIIT